MAIPTSTRITIEPSDDKLTDIPSSIGGTVMAMRCIYCDREPTADNPLTYEHIWPDALGGDYLPNPFNSDQVCRKCNSTCGLFVDGAFIKSWFGAAERATAAYDYVDARPGSKSTVPLHYMGVAADLPAPPGDVLELWLGPCGSHVLHFRPGEEGWSTYAGGRPSRKKTADRVYLSLTTKELVWVGLTLRSVQAQFPKATLFAVNFGFEGENPFKFQPLPKSESEFAGDLSAVEQFIDICQAGKQVRCNLAYQFGADTRWLAKIALGLGHTMLGDAFENTRSCSGLRQALWTKDAAARATIPIRGTGYLGTNANLGLLAWTGGWVLLLRAEGGELSVSVITPSGNAMHMMVCDDPEVIGAAALPAYQIFLTIPSLGVGRGPYALEQYLGHKMGGHPIPDLSNLYEGMARREDLPPCGPSSDV